MFDNPNKELLRLQEQLLAAEKKTEAPPPEKEDPEQVLAEVKQMLAEEDAPKQRVKPKPAEKAAKKPKQKTADKKETASQRKNIKDQTGGLWAALLLELGAIGLIALWWLLWR